MGVNDEPDDHGLPDYRRLLDEALRGVPSPEATATESRILDATLELVGRFGERRITIDDIAKQAGLSRMTVFRRFGSKDAVISETYLRESRNAIRDLRSATDDSPDAATALVDGYVCLVGICQASPVLTRLSRDEPEAIVRLFRQGDSSGLDLVSSLLEAVATRPASRLPITRAALAQLCDELALACFADVLASPTHSTASRRLLAANARCRGLIDQALAGAFDARR
jgi:AcrR family transcriptional regulator